MRLVNRVDERLPARQRGVLIGTSELSRPVA